MLGRAQLHEAQDFSLFELRQQRDRLLSFLRLGFFRLCFLIDGEESIEFDDGTRGPELDWKNIMIMTLERGADVRCQPPISQRCRITARYKK